MSSYKLMLVAVQRMNSREMSGRQTGELEDRCGESGERERQCGEKRR